MKIRPVGTELFHAEGQTDMTKLILVSRNFVKVPKSGRFEFPTLFTIEILCRVIS